MELILLTSCRLYSMNTASLNSRDKTKWVSTGPHLFIGAPDEIDEIKSRLLPVARFLLDTGKS